MTGGFPSARKSLWWYQPTSYRARTRVDHIEKTTYVQYIIVHTMYYCTYTTKPWSVEQGSKQLTVTSICSFLRWSEFPEQYFCFNHHVHGWLGCCDRYMYHRNFAPMPPVKYKYDAMDLTIILFFLFKSRYISTEKKSMETWVTPTPELSPSGHFQWRRLD